MKPVIIIVIAVVLLVPTTAFGVEGYFQSHYGMQVSQSPTVCIFQPDSYRVDEQKWDRWYPEMRAAIATWDAKLKGSTGSGGFWDITIVEVPLEKLDLLNISACDIQIRFTDERSDGSSALGWWVIDTPYVYIYFPLTEICAVEFSNDTHIAKYYYCDETGTDRPQRMAVVLQHELCHALGLPHYVTNDYGLFQQWFDAGGMGTPSIMTFVHPRDELQKVTNIDVELLKQIYYVQGFGKKKQSLLYLTNQIFLEPVIEFQTMEKSIRTEVSKDM